MKAKVVQDADVVTYLVVCDPGDEAVAALAQFARAERPEASQVTAVGAFERADGTTRGGHLLEGWGVPDPGGCRERDPSRAAQGDAARTGDRADRLGPVRVLSTGMDPGLRGSWALLSITTLEGIVPCC